MKKSLEEMAHYLNNVKIPIRIACITRSGWPVVISLWFQYENGLLYCATQRSAKVVSYLQNEPRCGFEIAEDRPPYCGIRGQAIAKIDGSLGAKVLGKLLVRYLGNKDNDLAKKLLAKSDNEVALVLEPKQIFTWDFSDRMANLNAGDFREKVCP